MNFKGFKIHTTSSFGREVKIGVPSHIFKAYKRNFLPDKEMIEGKIRSNFRSPTKLLYSASKCRYGRTTAETSGEKSGKNLKPPNPTEVRWITGNLNSFECCPNIK
jgi:hypothetical protein